MLLNYTFNNLTFSYEMVLTPEVCKRCAKGYLLNSTTGLCFYIGNKTVSINIAVKSIEKGYGTLFENATRAHSFYSNAD